MPIKMLANGEIAKVIDRDDLETIQSLCRNCSSAIDVAEDYIGFGPSEANKAISVLALADSALSVVDKMLTKMQESVKA